MQGDRRPIYGHRLVRDLNELLSHNFSCISSALTIFDNSRDAAKYSPYYGQCSSAEYGDAFSYFILLTLLICEYKISQNFSSSSTYLRRTISWWMLSISDACSRVLSI
jgi:hypothetical protein